MIAFCFLCSARPFLNFAGNLWFLQYPPRWSLMLTKRYDKAGRGLLLEEGMDHIFSREFFPIDKRAYILQVPACRKCNTAKSDLENRLACVLPFGSCLKDESETFN